MTLLDDRPDAIDRLIRAGNTYTLTLSWEDALAGRTFTSTLDGQALDVDIVGDVMTVTASAALTGALATGVEVQWLLVEEIDGVDQVVLVGTWTPDDGPRAGTSSAVTVTAGASEATVTVPGAGAVAALDVRVTTAEDDIDDLEAADTAHFASTTAHGDPLAELETHRARLHRSFITVTDDWLDRLDAVLALPDPRVMVLGDSVGQGNWASNWRNLGWVGLLTTALQAVHGDGGSGWIDCNWLPNGFIPGGGQVVETGSWTFVAGGPNGSGRRPTVAGNGATVTMPFRGTSVDILQRRGSGFGSWTHNIDGTGAVSVSAANATADVHTTTITGLAAGDHSITITATTGDCRIYGVRGRNDAGLRLDNMSQGGRAWVNNTGGAVAVTTATEGIAAGVNSTTLLATFTAATPIDVLLVAVAVNDANAATATVEAIQDVMGQCWEAARQAGRSLAEPPLVAMVIGHVGRHESGDSTPEYTKHAALYHGWAASIGAAVVDVWSFGRNSWDYWESLGYWGLDNVDNVHPGDPGHAAEADLVGDLFAV